MTTLYAIARELRRCLQHLLTIVADVEADGWDTDWVRLPRRYATAVLTDIDAELITPDHWQEPVQHAELLGSELALRRWLSTGESQTAFGAASEVVLEQLEPYRRAVRALGAGGTAA